MGPVRVVWTWLWCGWSSPAPPEGRRLALPSSLALRDGSGERTGRSGPSRLPEASRAPGVGMSVGTGRQYPAWPALTAVAHASHRRYFSLLKLGNNNKNK